MLSYFKKFTLPSEPLTDGDFEKMCEGGEVLERNECGAKVVWLTNGKILKVFRVKRLISGTRIYSYARRFCRNSRRLKEKNILTVTIRSLYHFESSNNTAVLYDILPGNTVRDILKKREASSDLVGDLAQFLSTLHTKGVHFHSLHLGNVVQTPEGELGLIDISDLSIYPWALFCNTKVRSFRRLCKYPEDIKRFGAKNWGLFQAVYFKKSNLKNRCKNKIREALAQLELF